MDASEVAYLFLALLFIFELYMCMWLAVLGSELSYLRNEMKKADERVPGSRQTALDFAPPPPLPDTPIYRPSPQYPPVDFSHSDEVV